MNFTITNHPFDHTYQNLTTSVFEGNASGTIIENPKEVAEYGWFTYQQTQQLTFAYDYTKVIKKLHDLKSIAD